MSIYGGLAGEHICCWLFRATSFRPMVLQTCLEYSMRKKLTPVTIEIKARVFVALLQVNENSVEDITLSLYEGSFDDTYLTGQVHFSGTSFVVS